ncbi:hypothetical protein BDV93DRAFT_610498 [Ceratobasidium sp. AG-I]|nr:hypothetical protein BDV93DRAFT_610498 [Ceratobasidium sp. AG-I]
MDNATQHTPVADSSNGPKYIMAFCDGTGKDGEARDKAGQAPANPTNVYRLFEQANEHTNGRPVTVDRNAYPVLSRYFAGVGSKSKGPEKYLALIFGMTTVNMVADVYLWVAENYQPGDHVCLFGYSRGAFVARKVAGLLHHVGLTTKKADLLRQWRNRETAIPWGETPTPSEIPIKYLGVWDTVGAVYSAKVSELKDTLGISDENLPPNVKHALHVVAFHENRKRFAVTLFKKGENKNGDLQEVWFPGAHSDVGGGGDKPTDLPNLSFDWMIGKVDVFAKFPKKVETNYATATLTPQDAYKESPPFKQVVDYKMNRLESKHLKRFSLVHETVRYLEDTPRNTPRNPSLLTLAQLREQTGWKDTQIVPRPAPAKPTRTKPITKTTWSFSALCVQTPTYGPITPARAVTMPLSDQKGSNHYCHILPRHEMTGWAQLVPNGGNLGSGVY